MWFQYLSHCSLKNSWKTPYDLPMGPLPYIQFLTAVLHSSLVRFVHYYAILRYDLYWVCSIMYSTILNKILILFWICKIHWHRAFMGEIWDFCCEYFGGNWPCYSGAAPSICMLRTLTLWPCITHMKSDLYPCYLTECLFLPKCHLIGKLQGILWLWTVKMNVSAIFQSGIEVVMEICLNCVYFSCVLPSKGLMD